MEILRDGLGVPHCYADDERDAFHAQGWVHAEDRLWQMEHDRRRARGRMAEILGPPAVAADVFYRRMDLESFVRRDHAALSAETTSMLAAYASGVNAWIAEHPPPREVVTAGIELEPWEPWHSLLVYRVRHLLMGSARSKLWRSVVADVLGAEVARTMAAGIADEQVACVPPGAPCPPGSLVGMADVDGGSNNWVVTGTRTASGRPILAGDPHRELEAPNVYVQGHVACPEWDVLGIGMPGVPGFPHFGHNATVAWSITHAMADDQDLYDHGQDAAAGGRTEAIRVRGGDDVEVEVVHTPHGPIIGEGLALRWTATAEVNLGFDAIVPMLRARSVGALFEAMRLWVEPVNSLIAADVDGAIGYLLRGRLPVRGSDAARWTPVPADEPAHEWTGWVPFDDLPRVVDPGGDFLFSANNQIAATPSAPYIGLDVAPPWRARRVVDALRSMDGVGVEAMADLHRDLVSLPARRFAARVEGWPPLAGWDGSMDVTSTAAGAYSVLRRELLLVVLERSGLDAAVTMPRNRLLPGVVPESVVWRVVERHLAVDDTSLLDGATWDVVLAEARARAERTWQGETWGDLHRSSQRHVLGVLDPELHPSRRLPVAGDLDTVFAAGYTPTTGFDVRAGSVARYAFDVADWDRSAWVVPLGAAGAAPDPHGVDQQEAWAAGRLFPAPYTRAAVEAAAGGPAATPR